MKATFHCSTLEQASKAIRFAFEEKINHDAEVVIDFPGRDDVPMRLFDGCKSALEQMPKNDTADALLPKSFFGAVGTRYLNDANKGKKLAFRLTGNGNSHGQGTLSRIENGDECLIAVIDGSDGKHRLFLKFDSYDFVFLE